MINDDDERGAMKLKRHCSAFDRAVVGGAVSKEFKVFLPLAGVALLAVVIYGQFFSTVAVQERNMEKARLHGPIVRGLLDKDPRFRRVSLLIWTSRGGSLLFSGLVRTEADLIDLKRLVDSTAPPMPIDWQVRALQPSERMLESP